MIRYLLALGCATVLACASPAQEPKVAQPKPKVVAVPQQTDAAKRAVEEVESIEAHLQTRKAYIQAAKVAVDGARLALDRAKNAGPLSTRQAIEEAELGVRAAEAQYMIREAEANEVAVKLKHAKRRAEEARQGGGEKVLFEKANAKMMVADLQRQLARVEDELTRLEKSGDQGLRTRTELQLLREQKALLRAEIEVYEKRLQPAGEKK